MSQTWIDPQRYDGVPQRYPASYPMSPPQYSSPQHMAASSAPGSQPHITPQWPATPHTPSTPVNLALHQQAYAAYQQGQSQPGTSGEGGTGVATRTRRPLPLTLAVSSGAAAAMLTVAAQLLALRSGRATVATLIEEQLPAPDRLPGASALVSSVVNAAVDQAYATIHARATISIGLAVMMALFVLWSLRAGLAARMLAVAAVALNALMLMVCLADVFPQDARLVGMAAMVVHPITAALLFLPAVGAYRAARRTSRAGATARRADEIGAPLIPGMPG